MKKSLADALKKNTSLKCSVNGCPWKRYRLHPVCYIHNRNLVRFGHHSSQKYLDNKILSESKQKVDAVLAINQNVAVFKYCIDKFESILRKAKAGLDPTRAGYFKIMANQGVTGLDVFSTACAVTVYFYSHQNRHIHDQRHCDVLTVIRIAKLARGIWKKTSRLDLKSQKAMLKIFDSKYVRLGIITVKNTVERTEINKRAIYESLDLVIPPVAV